MSTVTTHGRPEPVEGYESFFGLNEAPFSLAPDPRFLFASASHSAALAQVAYALERREPLVVITGEIGTGKTLLCRTVLQQLRRKTFLSVISDPLLERDDILKQLLQDFGVISKDRTKLTEASRHDLVQTLDAFLRSLAAIQAHAVVIIDEAQHLQPDVLEQIRLLSNIDDERGTLLQIILVGQTDLEPLLFRPELRQLQQRVSRRLRLEPLNRAEVEQYIKHRLALARDGMPPNQLLGANELAQVLAEWAGTNAGVEFTPDAIHAVSQLSGGLPRVINLLCDRSLEEAYACRLRIIDGPLIHTAARALGVGEQAAGATTAATVNAPARSTQVGPDEPFWTAMRSESEAPDKAVQPGDEPVPVEFDARIRPAAAPRFAMYLVLAASLAFGGVAIWLGLRGARPTEALAPPSVAAPAASAPLVFSARPDPALAVANASVPQAAATTGTPTPPEATAPSRSAVAATATGGRFDIVVASFRTDARATPVAAEVAALGLPVRRRVSDGWQQVISGPFTSRTYAEDAQQRLHRAGLTGTQIVPTGR
jgi:type II secretory pathway predicted ATPase ExeA/cell division septation protein DedD